jgi:hypothetical protein
MRDRDAIDVLVAAVILSLPLAVAIVPWLSDSEMKKRFRGA